MAFHTLSRAVRTGTAVAGAVLLALTAAAPAFADIHIRFGTRERPLEGRRYETMRALPHDLDERAECAAEAASGNARRGDRADRRFADSVIRFSKQARSFHERMDRFVDSPWDVPNEDRRLFVEAHQ